MVDRCRRQNDEAEIGRRVIGMMLHHQSAGKHQLNAHIPPDMS